MTLKLFNTLTRRAAPFHSIEEGRVSLYTCGPTVYNYAHIGNLRSYVFEDVLKRILLWEGYRVKHVMNITDVGHLTSDADTGEDKMERSAQRQGRTVWEIAAFYTECFQRDMQRLHLMEPDIWCRATDHIEEQIALVKTLEERGFAYHLDDGLYFDTSRLADYGKLARLDVEGLKAGARVEWIAGKKNPTDFALWKFSPKDARRLMEWQSPWGVGFPGWHIECSAMAMKYLGDRIDIHCGGEDHIGVHHTNEIAQAEAATGHAWVDWWLHGAFLVLGKDGKMAKSGENFLTLDVLIDRGYDPLAYRYFLLNAHYRSPLTFTWEALDGAASAWRRLRERVLECRRSVASPGAVLPAHLAVFREAVEDDMNMPRALASMWGVLRDHAAGAADRYATLLEMDKVFGFDFARMEMQPAALDAGIQALILERDRARRERNYAKADAIRDQLRTQGILLEDSPEGSTWKRKS